MWAALACNLYWPLAEFGALWADEPAAGLLSNDARPGDLAIYLEKLPAVLAAKHEFLTEPAPGDLTIIATARSLPTADDIGFDGLLGAGLLVGYRLDGPLRVCGRGPSHPR